VGPTTSCQYSPMPNSNPSDASAGHYVAVIGGAVAGAEIAGRLAEKNIRVAVIEQNARPYGKIEDGLPRWHMGLRRKEYASINSKLSHPLVRFVPNTTVGRDVAFPELVNDWGFTSVILANGAWRDRPLPIEGADAYVGKGLVYQNPFVIAFNHEEDAAFSGERFEILDGSLVVGGGLASIDVAKIHTLHCTRAKLAERGIDITITELEVKGIPKTLAAHDLEWKDLGLKGCTIYYRRCIEDMPLATAPDGATPERIEKVRKGRRTIANKASQKFMLEIEELSAPDALLVEDGRVVGLRLRRTRLEDGRVKMTDETYEARGPAVVSSIGSIPAAIEGIDMRGELFDFQDWTYGRLDRYPSVFAAGNIVTGKGNIVASRKHAAQVSTEAVERFLGVADEGGDSGEAGALSDEASKLAEALAQEVGRAEPVAQAGLDAVDARVEARQREVGYPGDLKAWLDEAGEPC